ncbi:hypothetical protein DPMN_075961 [Dreissena polymorpha]|uniref:Uncharacterized protein n=1 Tax=Dreissena polymorpha TaxID=45954 RepID=A0A9D3YMR4_DREPO|nr:hypothetical protein DPMN_075961 [Dreissena polymorpha]
MAELMTEDPAAFKNFTRIGPQVPRGGNLATIRAKQERLYLKLYFNTIGSVEWQDRMIESTL